jgi:hypothetical protein
MLTGPDMTMQVGIAPELQADGTPRQRRQVVRRGQTRLLVGPTLYQVMEPGERILAGACGWTGRRRTWRSPGEALVFALGLVIDAPFHLLGRGPLLVSIPLGIVLYGAPVLSAAMRGRNRQVFLAVTDRQLICVANSRTRGVQQLFHSPLAMVRMRGASHGPRVRSVIYLGPGAKDRGTRITVTGVWRRDLDDIVAILRGHGIAVDGYVPAWLPTTERGGLR